MAADLKIYARNLEEEARNQIDALANCPVFEGSKIRIMPDAHAGKGCVIGFTADLGTKLVPNLVGVDIGCGMYACRLDDPLSALEDFDAQVKRSVPMGHRVHSHETADTGALGLLCFDSLRNIGHLDCSLGTLGGGNHFIEVDEDETGAHWIVIHTGSRNLGLQVANIYQVIADETCEDDVPNELKYLSGDAAEAYLHDMMICQAWAVKNREAIFSEIARNCGISSDRSFHTVHNYIGEDGIIRKGAISAKQGEEVLIPLNMRDGAIIGEGLGNKDWNESAPHGAGRVMSRSKARKSLSLEEFQVQMRDAGVYTTTANQNTLDEAPAAYKPADEILELMKPTVRVTHRLKPIYNVKATDGTGWRKKAR